MPQSDTWLDLIICNDLNKVTNFGQETAPGVSYHDMIYVEIDLSVKMNKKPSVVVRDFKNIRVDDLKAECADIQWNELYQADSIDDKVLFFSNKLNVIFNKYVPERKMCKQRHSCPWLTNHIKDIMKERDILYKRYTRTKNLDVWESYRILRNRVKRMLRDERNRHFKLLLGPDKSNKNIWSVLKTQGTGKQDNKVGEPIVNLNNLNDYFCGIENRIDYNLLHYYESQRNPDNESFMFTNITEEQIFGALNKISSNAVGPDGIQIRFIKIVLFSEIKHVICHIFNYSIVNCVYPSQWKKATILPLPKTASPVSCNQYRPINILCVLGKLLDKIVYFQINNFVDRNNIMYKYQSGY